MAASAEDEQISVSPEVVATNEHWEFSGGETLIEKLPDELLVCAFLSSVILIHIIFKCS
jgi:hypothetical protein